MWTVLQHAAWEDPGLIADALDAHAHEFRIIRLDRGEPVPRAVPQGLVVMGGPMGVYEAERYAFITAELQLLAECAAAGIPVMGVCLGAQLLAAALGATVTKGPGMEEGGGWVRLTEAGQKDPVLGADGPELPVVHWHQDTYALPDGAVLLASSDRYEQQGFRLGERVYGLQFHIEVDESLAQQWRERGLKLDREHVEKVSLAGRALFDRFLHVTRAGG
ncbi:MAG: type 1 glutamine amidotransferase [Terriglobales bacterium]